MYKDQYGNYRQDYSLDLPDDDGESFWERGRLRYKKYFGFIRGFLGRGSSICPQKILLERWITELEPKVYAGTVPAWISYFYNEYCVRDQSRKYNARQCQNSQYGKWRYTCWPLLNSNMI